MQKNLFILGKTAGLIGLLAAPWAASFGATIDIGLQQETPVALSAGDAAQLSAAKGGRGWYDHGLVRMHDGAFDLREMYALRFDVMCAEHFDGRVELVLAEGQGRRDRLETSSAKFQLDGPSTWRTLEIPVESFDYARGEQYFLKFIGSIRFHAVAGRAEIRNVRFVEAPTVKLSAYTRSKPAENGSATYEFEIKNCADTEQDFRLAIAKDGWEGMPAKLSDDFVRLTPGAARKVTLSVEVPAKLPPGAHESQRVIATPLQPNGHAAELEFITVQRVASPFLIHDAEGWNEVREKASQYPWARKKADEIIKSASEWQPPTSSGVMSDQGTTGVCPSAVYGKLADCTIAYQLTGDAKLAGKMHSFLLLFSNPTNGFPVLLHATHQGMPQEGGALQAVSEAYDVLHDQLSLEDRAQVDNSLRVYVDTLIDGLANAGISNWSIFNQVPGAGCALLLHDLVRFNALLYGRTGLIDQFRYGIMDDGWWYEMSITYNVHCAENFTRLALVAQRFGVDLVRLQFPAATSDLIGIRPYERTNFEGMNFQKFGPLRRNMIGFKAMWDAILPYPDYRGIMIGMGDGHEMKVSGYSYDLAYYVFGDPRYASLLQNPDDRDLLFGVPELPSSPTRLYQQSAHSDNAGIAILRSQNGDIRDRIQLGFKYGTHGGYHGHFDRLSLLCLMRYGRGFWNPESTWYGYGSYMYKWWVQPSLAHNMVMVDGKQQEPSECRPLLFHSGSNLQVIAAESSPRWSHPPYLGGYDLVDKIKAGEERYVPIPDEHPELGAVTGFTEPIFTRRLQMVTDDYVLIADYLKGEREHTFDNMIHLRGAKPVAGLAETGHRAQYDPSPLSSGQFIVNCDEYELTAPAKLTSWHHFNEKGDNGQNKRAFNELTDVCYHEPGELFIDEYAVFPAKAQLLLADYPEVQSIAKRLTYEVRGDEKVLATGMFRSWILGTGNIDVDVTGVKTLALATTKDGSKNVADTLFWANAVIQTRDGKTVKLSELKHDRRGLKDDPAPGADFDGGAVRISGTAYADTMSAEPLKDQEPGTLTFDLSGLDAIRLRAVVGGDFPVGQEQNLRKTVAVRTVGAEASFLTVLEPREGDAKIASVVALDAGTVKVVMTDGRVDRIEINGLATSGGQPTVNLYRNDALIESTGASQ